MIHPSFNPNSKWLQLEAPRLQLESMWLVAQKFGYLNCLGPQELRAALAAGPRPDIDSYAGSSSDSLFRLIQRQRLAGDRPPYPADVLKTRGPAEIFGFNSRWLCDLSKIRYCEPCMDQWFHSTLFQLPAIEKCPWHGVHLSDTCQHCGKAMPGFEIPRMQTELLRCLHCQQPYSKKAISMDALFSGNAWLTRILNTFGKLQGQIEGACKQWVLESRDQFDLLAYADNRNVIRARSFEMLWTVSLLGEALPKCCGRSPGMFTSLVARHATAPTDESVEVMLGRLKTLGAQVKSVGRHLQRKVRRICGHTQPLRPDFSYDGIGREYRFFVLFQDQECQCCAALALWRAKFALLFAVIKRLQDRIAHNCRTDLRQLANWVASERITAEMAYAMFSETVLSFSTCRGMAKDVAQNIRCMYQETVGQAYRARGMPWVEEGAIAWRAASGRGDGFVFLNERLVDEMLQKLNERKLLADVCPNRWTSIEPGIWHLDLAEVQWRRRWHEIGLA